MVRIKTIEVSGYECDKKNCQPENDRFTALYTDTQ